MSSPSFPKLPVPPAEFSPLSLLRMLWLHKFSILAIWLAVSGITVAIVSRIPATYTADAQILVDPPKIPEKFVPSIVSTDVQDRLATISQQVLSTDLLQKVIDDFNLYGDERRSLANSEITALMRKSITVKLERVWTNNRPGAFRIGYTGTDPSIVAQVANRIANLFVEENMRTREVQAEGTSEFIEAQLVDAKKRLAEMESSISAYRIRHNGELPEQAIAITGTLSRLQLEEAGNREAIGRAESSKSMLESTLGLAESTVDTLMQNATQATTPPDDSTRAAAVVVPPRPKKPSETLERQLMDLKARLGDAHPDVKRLVRQIAVAQQSEAQEEQEAAATPAAQLPAPKPRGAAEPVRTPAIAPSDRPEVVQARERAQMLRSQIALTEKDIATRQTDRQKLAAAITDYQNRLNAIPLREQEIGQIMRDHASLLGEYQSLQSKNSVVRISTDMELRQKSERFAINDPAHVPGVPVSPNRPALDSIGSLAGLGFGCLIAFVREFRNGRLLGAWELPEGAVVLARVPHIAPLSPRDGDLGTGWSWTRRVAVISLLLIPLLGFLAFRLHLSL